MNQQRIYQWARFHDPLQGRGWFVVGLYDGEAYGCGSELEISLDEIELGPVIVLPTSLRIPDADHRHRAVRRDEHEVTATNTIVRREFCECGAIRMARAPTPTAPGIVEFGPWLRA